MDDDDVIGSESERAPEPRGTLRRGVPLPAAVHSHRRLAVTLLVLVAFGGVVAISRAGVHGLKSAEPAVQAAGPPAPPLSGQILALAAGQNVVYVVADDCAQDCRPLLVATGDDGRTWAGLRLPGAPVTAATARTWRLTVTGGEDLLAIQDPAGKTVTVGSTSSRFQTHKIVDGPPLARAPAGWEAMLDLCPRIRCATPALEYVEPRTGVRSLLETQPPVPARVLGVGGSQIWVAGVDPGTRQWAAAVSADDGATWATSALPGVSTAAGLVAQLLPVPELDQAYLVLGKPDGQGGQALTDIWSVRASGAPSQVRPSTALGAVEGAVATKDGRLVLTGTTTTVLSPDGGEKRSDASDVDSTRFVLSNPMRGPHQLLVAAAIRTDGAASIALSGTGDAGDWDVRPIVLAR
ncbi:MAG TPA: hypothetical protein VGP36_06965 [Mycobacteriales bacterium]|nr:hypothetical protein [Mycobacteriales bacterium]